MDLFKRASNKMATALDWNCPKVCKRCKGDTQKIHKQARKKLKENWAGLITLLKNK